MEMRTLSPQQRQALHALWGVYSRRFLTVAKENARSERLAWASRNIERAVESFTELSVGEAAQLIELMKQALGQETKVVPRPRRDLALAYGTAGQRKETSNQIQMVDAPTLELLDRLLGQLGWSPERLDVFLHSRKSPVRRGAIRTLGEANRVIWALKRMLRRRESSASDAAELKRAG
jgi:hypothetical protein